MRHKQTKRRGQNGGKKNDEREKERCIALFPEMDTLIDEIYEAEKRKKKRFVCVLRGRRLVAVD